MRQTFASDWSAQHTSVTPERKLNFKNANWLLTESILILFLLRNWCFLHQPRVHKRLVSPSPELVLNRWGGGSLISFDKFETTWYRGSAWLYRGEMMPPLYFPCRLCLTYIVHKCFKTYLKLKKKCLYFMLITLKTHNKKILNVYERTSVETELLWPLYEYE